MRTLVVNAGSSSLKLAVVEDGEIEHRSTVERWEGESHLEPLTDYLARCGEVDAVGHRVVHGGPRYREAVRIDDQVTEYLDSISDLAPLHNPRAVAGVRALTELLPTVPAMAAFDTAFHASLPAAAATYAVPREWNERFGLRRYGFHGLSHAHAVRRGAEVAGRAVDGLRVVSCHLGAGCSLTASLSGVALDTTMGFTPLAGLVMQTRSGSIDPGLLLWLLRHGGVDADELNDVLESRSGLRGLSGTSGDLRDVLAGVADGNPDCQLAFDVYLHRLVREIGAMAAAAGGVDLLVFTGGVGEHSPEVRASATSRLRHLGVLVDGDANDRATPDVDITAEGSTVSTVVVTAGEELEIAREAARVLG